VSCGVLLITHPGVGHTLLATATSLLQRLPLKAQAFEVPLDADLDALLPLAKHAMEQITGAEGALLLTDVYGASPANLAARLAHNGKRVRRVAALNLPMLLRVMTSAVFELDALAVIAADGARNGVIIDDA